MCWLDRSDGYALTDSITLIASFYAMVEERRLRAGSATRRAVKKVTEGCVDVTVLCLMMIILDGIWACLRHPYVAR
jgi:hypothetical protein